VAELPGLPYVCLRVPTDGGKTLTACYAVRLALGKKENIEGLAPLLNGRLYLMRGNHDRRSNGFYQRLGITLVPDPYLLIHPSGLNLAFSHRPIVPLEPGVLNLHGHVHNSIVPELGARHINLCVEVRDYRPWRLGDMLTPYIIR
jgi:calcineurin-like phosphoesterase family protein